jgi:uncharacterized NAD(P)/FAD-binding protein YdhS
VRTRQVIAVVGAGFSGTLSSLQLLRAAPDAQVMLIERVTGFGRGVAYSTHNPGHILNVRVANMSAWPDQPHHLSDWLNARGRAVTPQSSAFITRETYGDYIAEMLRAAVREPEGAERLVLVHDEVVRLARGPLGVELTLAMGRTIMVDAAVLALGGLRPTPLIPSLRTLKPSLFSADPWSPAALEGLAPFAPVVLMGTGLTMIDAVLSLESRGHRGPIWSISRRGLVPRSHGGAAAPTSGATPPRLPLSWALRRVRRDAADVGWRCAIDKLRPFTQQAWRALAPEEKGRFLRHLRPWWDAHRHRMAPAVAAQINALQAEGRLVVRAGRILDAVEDKDVLRIAWRQRGRTRTEFLRAARIINCTGLGGDARETAEPLLRDLIASGAARSDPLGLGIDVDDDSRVVDASGSADRRLFAVGPLTRGALWEIVAVPDIRNQVASVAHRVAVELGAARCDTTDPSETGR